MKIDDEINQKFKTLYEQSEYKFNKAKQGGPGSLSQTNSKINKRSASIKNSLTPYGNRRNNGLLIKPDEHEIDLMEIINKTSILFKNEDSFGFEHDVKAQS